MPSAAGDKEKGNAAFKAGDYAAAIGHYSAAILKDRNDFTLPLNRAAAYLKLSKHEDAERDCTRVLVLNSGNAKALFRRAQARVGLQRPSDAQQDLQEALRIEPKNDAINAELARVASLLQKGKARAQPRAPIEVTAPPLEPPKRRRVPIKIVEPNFSVTLKADPTPSAPSPSNSSAELLNPVSTRHFSTPPAANKAPPPTASTTPSSFQEAKKARASKPSGGIFRPSGSHTIFNSIAASELKAESKPAEKAPVSNAKGQSENTSAAPLPSPVLSDTSTKPPWTLFVFSRNWEALSTPEDRWKLLSRVPPAGLPALFQTSLEPPLLISILSAFQSLLTSPAHEAQRSDIRTWILDYLTFFPRVSRFGTITIFMNATERTLVRNVLEAVNASDDLMKVWQ